MNPVVEDRRTRFPDARFLAIAVVLFVSYYVVVIVFLHIVSPEIHPTRQFMSEYVVGRYGTLMTTTFFALGLGSLALSLALMKRRRAVRAPENRIGDVLDLDPDGLHSRHFRDRPRRRAT